MLTHSFRFIYLSLFPSPDIISIFIPYSATNSHHFRQNYKLIHMLLIWMLFLKSSRSQTCNPRNTCTLTFMGQMSHACEIQLLVMGMVVINTWYTISITEDEFQYLCIVPITTRPLIKSYNSIKIFWRWDTIDNVNAPLATPL